MLSFTLAGVLWQRHRRPLSLAGLVTLFASLLLVSAVPAEPQGKEIDHPDAAAAFHAKMRRSLENVSPADALPRAIAQVRDLRVAVATRAGVHPMAMAEFAGRGRQLAAVAGIPVGPLPAQTPSTHLPLNNPAGLPDEVLNRIKQKQQPQSLPLTGSISPGGWVWLGPGNVGGRTRAIAIDPNDPKTLWLGGVAGGVWRTQNTGASWAPLYDFMGSLVVCCMVLDPTDPEILFVGTGEGFYNLDAMRGAGIFRSSDGGASWEQLGATKGDDFRWINRLAISHDGQALLAATRAGLFRSTDGGQTFVKAKLAADGSDEAFGKEVLDVRFHPTDAQRCVAGGRNGNAFYSEDGGAGWKAAQGIAAVQGFGGRVELTYAVADPMVVYASADLDTGHVYRSTDGGKTYTLRGKPGHLAGQGWYANCLWAGDPTDPNLLVVGGLDLYRSSNGGTTFTQISRWESAPLSAHADHHVIVAHPAYDGVTNKTVYCGNDGGIYEAADVTTVQQQSGWRNLNHGLGITQFYGAGANRQTGQIIAGAQDNGTLLYSPPSAPPGPNQGVEGWVDLGVDDSPTSGDGGSSAADPDQPFFFGEYVYLQIHRGDGHTRPKSIYQNIADAGDGATALFIAPFVLDPNDPKGLFAGGARLWYSKDVQTAAPAFKAIKDPFGSTLISAVAVAQGHSDVIWVGHEYDGTNNSGAVFRTKNGSANSPEWQRVGAGGLPKRHCTRLVIDPRAADTVYAAFGGYSRENLWRTTDGGAHWQGVGTNVLPEAPVYDLAIHPDNSKILVAGTEVGLFVSDDGGQTWSPTNQGPTNCAVYQLFWMGKTLVSVTHGRGIFKIDLSGADESTATRIRPLPLPKPKEIKD